MNRLHFDHLPREMKERILDYTNDPMTISKVSKVWKDCVKNSKKMMQRELDNYFFFYAVWVRHPEPVMYVFPIVTEEQLLFLRQHESNHSQVGALERRNDVPLSLFEKGGFIFPDKLSVEEKRREKEENVTLGNTESLVEHLKADGDKAAYLAAYLEAIHDKKYTQVPSSYVQLATGDVFSIFSLSHQCTPLCELGLCVNNRFLPFLKKKVRFSSRETMMGLLKGEHLVLRGFAGSLFSVRPRNYLKLEKFFEEERNKPPSKRIKSTAINRLELLNKSYLSITRSLLKPRWWNFKHELETQQDFKLLTDANKRNFGADVWDISMAMANL